MTLSIPRSRLLRRLVTDANTFASTAAVTFCDANAQLNRQGCALATGRRFE